MNKQILLGLENLSAWHSQNADRLERLISKKPFMPVWEKEDNRKDIRWHRWAAYCCEESKKALMLP
jgi:hypothetical protein